MMPRAVEEVFDAYPYPIARMVGPDEVGRRNPSAIELHNLLEMAADYRLDGLIEVVDPKIDELVAIVRGALAPWSPADE